MKLVAVLLVVGTVAGGCGVRRESDARTIDRKEVPFGLLARSPDTGTTSPGPRTIELYFLSSDRLVSVARPNDRSIDAPEAIGTLLRGPTKAELEVGLTTALPTRDSAELIDVRSGVAHVRLSTRFRDGTVSDQTRALAQIVYTLTAVPGIASVEFSIAGHPVIVPRGDGTLADTPLDRSDYAALTQSSG